LVVSGTGRCGGQFDIGLKDTTEDTEGGRKGKRCSFCNYKELIVRDVKWQDRIPTPFIEFFDDGPVPTSAAANSF